MCEIIELKVVHSFQYHVCVLSFLPHSAMNFGSKYRSVFLSNNVCLSQRYYKILVWVLSTCKKGKETHLLQCRVGSQEGMCSAVLRSDWLMVAELVICVSWGGGEKISHAKLLEDYCSSIGTVAERFFLHWFRFNFFFFVCKRDWADLLNSS